MHILLKKNNNYNGILIITHKEYIFFRNKLSDLKKKKYYILCHYGFMVSIQKDNNIDNYLISNSRCIEKCLPFTSRNFLSNNFSEEKKIDDINNLFKKYNINIKLNKKIDFLYVGRAVEIKKLINIFLQFLEFNKINKEKYNICFVILKQEPNEYYYKFLELYNKYKTNNCILIDTHNLNIENYIFHGLTHNELSIIYGNSNIYIHGCEAEGESRSIQEGLLSGCLVMAKENMIGGGLDYLNIDNSVLYNDNNILNKMLESIEKIKNYKKDINIDYLINEKYTVDKFLKILYNNYNYTINFDIFKNNCDTTNLCFSLPGHNLNVMWYIKNKNTADILSEEQFNIFVKYI